MTRGCPPVAPPKVIHLMAHPVPAKRFVEPLVAALQDEGVDAQLWVEPVVGVDAFFDSMAVSKRWVCSNLHGNPLRWPGTVWALVRLFRAERPECVHAHLSRGALLPLLAARLTGVPLRVYHNHGVPFLGYAGPVRVALRALEWLNGRLATHALTVGAPMREILAPLIGDRDLQVLGPGSACGIDEADLADTAAYSVKVQAKQEAGYAPDQLIVLFVGRPYRRKGFHLILETWRRTFADRRDATLLVAGCSPADVARVLPDAPANIVALGYREELRPYYQMADVVALPSAHEGFGYALLEGAARRCALIASRIPGPDVLVEDGGNGWLVAANSHDDLARALREADADRGRLETMGERSGQIAARYARRAVVHAYWVYFDTLISSLKRGSVVR